jgi:hypothetical protein
MQTGNSEADSERLRAKLAMRTLHEATKEWGAMPILDLVVLLAIRVDDTQSVLKHGENLGLGNSSISQIIGRLATNAPGSAKSRRDGGGLGLVELHPHPQDGRAKVPRLTKAGKRFVSSLLAGLTT